jgi:hypothetical protein
MDAKLVSFIIRRHMIFVIPAKSPANVFTSET